MSKLKFLLIIFISISCLIGHAANSSVTLVPPYKISQYDDAITRLYQTSLNKPHLPVSERVAIASAAFLGKPYSLFSLGEGKEGKFDQDPLYRTDTFDCMTYVEMVMALALSQNLTEFQQKVKTIRYEKGEVSYFKRNHFTSVDWNLNNQAQGYIKDITKNLGASVQTASVLINKPNWYRYKKISDLQLEHDVSEAEAKQLLQAWQAAPVSSVKSYIEYIPLNELFLIQQNQLVPQYAIFDRIPSGSIIEIVTRNSFTKDKIGTDLNVLHMGLAIRTSQGLMFREASAVAGQVQDIPLMTYLGKRFLYGRNPNAIGIHVELITKPN